MLATAYALAQTFDISARAIANAVAGRLTPEWVDVNLAAWSRRVVEYAGVDLSVDGHVDWARSYVLMSNHQSHFDIPILYRVVNGRMRMVAKTELFKIPVFSRAMRVAQMVEIDRSDRARAIASLKAAGELIRSGVNVWIAPEGTRSKTGELGRLKKGGFMLAVETGTPILPIAIRGTHDILPPGAVSVRRGQRVHVTFGAPIEVEGRTVESLMDEVGAFLAAHVRD